MDRAFNSLARAIADASTARIRRLERDHLVYGSLEPSRSIFMVRSGAVEIFHEDEKLARANEVDEDGDLQKRIKLEWIKPGDVFGEAEFLRRTPKGNPVRRMFSARAVVATDLIELDYDTLGRLIATRPELDAALKERVFARLDALAIAIGEARFLDKDILLARVLRDLSTTIGVRAGQVVRFRERVPQTEIALAIGVARESASMRLKDWERAGLLRTGRDQELVLTDFGRIELIAGIPRSPGHGEHEDAIATLTAAIAAGDNFRARNLALGLLPFFPLSPEVQYAACLAAARAGAFDEAQRLARRFGFDAAPDVLRSRLDAALRNPVARRSTQQGDDAEDHDWVEDEAAFAARLRQLCEDAAALLPRIHKDRAAATADPDMRAKALSASLEGYEAAYKATGGAFTGINAATVAKLAGQAGRAEELARSVLQRLRAPKGYWDYATVAEARALLSEWEPARAALRQAIKEPDARPGALASTRLQLVRLRGTLDPVQVDGLLAALPASVSVAYTGHMMRGGTLDAAGQQAAAEELTPALDELLRRHGPVRAYGALAAGADIIMAERVLAAGGELHVVLPMRFGEFIEASVVPGDPPGTAGRRWADRFDDCLARAHSVTVVHDGPFEAGERDALFHHAFRQAAGLALLRADEMVGEARLLAVYDGGAADNIAGTAMAVHSWAESGASADVIPCPWRRGTPGPAIAVATPFRPVVFVWSVLDDARRGRLQDAKRRGRAGLAQAMEAEVEAFKAAVGTLLAGARLVPRTDQTQLRLGIAAVFEDVPAALAAAANLAQAAPHAGAGEVRVVCDHGLVVDRRGEPHAERLGRLRAASDVPEVPSGLVAATEAFTAEARLTAPRAFLAQPMGRVALSGRGGGEPVPLPSVRLFRLDPPG